MLTKKNAFRLIITTFFFLVFGSINHKFKECFEKIFENYPKGSKNSGNENRDTIDNLKTEIVNLESQIGSLKEVFIKKTKKHLNIFPSKNTLKDFITEQIIKDDIVKFSAYLSKKGGFTEGVEMGDSGIVFSKNYAQFLSYYGDELYIVFTMFILEEYENNNNNKNYDSSHLTDDYTKSLCNLIEVKESFIKIKEKKKINKGIKNCDFLSINLFFKDNDALFNNYFILNENITNQKKRIEIKNEFEILKNQNGDKVLNFYYLLWAFFFQPSCYKTTAFLFLFPIQIISSSPIPFLIPIPLIIYLFFFDLSIYIVIYGAVIWSFLFYEFWKIKLSKII